MTYAFLGVGFFLVATGIFLLGVVAGRTVGALHGRTEKEWALVEGYDPQNEIKAGLMERFPDEYQ